MHTRILTIASLSRTFRLPRSIRGGTSLEETSEGMANRMGESSRKLRSSNRIPESPTLTRDTDRERRERERETDRVVVEAAGIFMSGYKRNSES